jgi:Fe-S-cluster-containing hydrogenase component 2
VSELHQPLKSLKEGRWFKLICGASYQHLPAIRNLALAYALAGADCVDVSADPAVLSAVLESFQVVSHVRDRLSSVLGDAVVSGSRPWLMVSLSDGDDPHFRKAIFDPKLCPPDCSKPCIAACPVDAIAVSSDNAFESDRGVIESRCYGCGRCIPVCPVQQIQAQTYTITPAAIAPQILQGVDALEIHTQVGREIPFIQLLTTLRPWLSQLKLLAVSCPNGHGVIAYLWHLHSLLAPLGIPLIWQTDGRPMSGDIGIGTTHAAIKFGYQVLQDGPPGYVQLAGGTNAYTVTKLRRQPYIDRAPPQRPQERPTFGGIAYGGYARQLLGAVLDQLENTTAPRAVIPFSPGTEPSSGLFCLERFPELLVQAVTQAHGLVSSLKQEGYPGAGLPVELRSSA